MDIVLEILQALVYLTSIAKALFELLERWRNYKHQRMAEGRNKETGGNRSL